MDSIKIETDGLIREGEDVGDVATEGLKTIKKRMIDNQCAGLLAPSDWMVVRAQKQGVTMDSGLENMESAVRTKCNSMQTQIDNASDVDALAALFTYTEQEDGSNKTTRRISSKGVTWYFIIAAIQQLEVTR